MTTWVMKELLDVQEKLPFNRLIVGIDGRVRLVHLHTDNSVCFFINKRTNDKLPFV
jgi:hypothetical protein